MTVSWKWLSESRQDQYQGGKSLRWERGLFSYPITCLELENIPNGVIVSEFPKTLLSAPSGLSGPATAWLHGAHPEVRSGLHVVVVRSRHLWRCLACGKSSFSPTGLLFLKACAVVWRTLKPDLCSKTLLAEGNTPKWLPGNPQHIWGFVTVLNVPELRCSSGGRCGGSEQMIYHSRPKRVISLYFR